MVTTIVKDNNNKGNSDNNDNNYNDNDSNNNDTDNNDNDSTSNNNDNDNMSNSDADPPGQTRHKSSTLLRYVQRGRKQYLNTCGLPHEAGSGGG